MKALMMNKDGSVAFADAAKPKIKPDQVLIKVAACGICGTDLHIHRGMANTWALPGIIGHEFSGTVLELGADVRHRAVGDKVTVQPIVHCGHCDQCLDGKTNICENVLLIGGELSGGCAEYAAVPENSTILLPAFMPVEQGALAEPAATCVHAIRRLGGRHYRRVLLIGAGAIGLLALSAIREYADTLVVTDTVQTRLELAMAIGATACVRADLEDVETRCMELSDGKKYDLVIEAVGYAETREQGFRLMRAGADYLFLGLGERFTQVNFTYMITNECTFYGTQCHTTEDFEEALRLINDGTIAYDRLVTRLPIEQGEKAFDNPQIGIKIHLIP